MESCGKGSNWQSVASRWLILGRVSVARVGEFPVSGLAVLFANCYWLPASFEIRQPADCRHRSSLQAEEPGLPPAGEAHQGWQAGGEPNQAHVDRSMGFKVHGPADSARIVRKQRIHGLR